MNGIENILFFVEDEPDLEILDRTFDLAEVFGARLTVATTVRTPPTKTVLSRHGFEPGELERLVIEDRRSKLADAIEKVGRPGVDTKTVVLTGAPVPAIVGYVQEQGFDYLYKEPSPSHGLRKPLFGSIDLQLMRTAPCKVGIGRTRKTDGPLRAVVAVDIDVDDERKAALNRRLLDGIQLARAGEHVEAYVLHAWDLYGYSILAHGRGKIAPERLEEAVEQERASRQEWLETLIDRHREELGSEQAEIFDPKPLLVRGDPRTVIPSKIRELDADILGIGTASRTGMRGVVVGNTSEEILHRVDCTVIVVKPEGFESPFA